MEVYLKAVIEASARVSVLETDNADELVEGLRSRLFSRHGIRWLLDTAQELFRQLGDAPHRSPEISHDTVALLRAVDAVDPSSSVFRYPVDTDGSAGHPQGARMNALVFAEKSDSACEELDALCLGLNHEFSVSAERAYHIQEFLSSLAQDGAG